MAFHYDYRHCHRCGDEITDKLYLVCDTVDAVGGGGADYRISTVALCADCVASKNAWSGEHGDNREWAHKTDVEGVRIIFNWTVQGQCSVCKRTVLRSNPDYGVKHRAPTPEEQHKDQEAIIRLAKMGAPKIMQQPLREVTYHADDYNQNVESDYESSRRAKLTEVYQKGWLSQGNYDKFRFKKGSSITGRMRQHGVCSAACQRALERGRRYYCQHCGERFTPKRADAKFCSGKCRVAAHRSLTA